MGGDWGEGELRSNKKMVIFELIQPVDKTQNAESQLCSLVISVMPSFKARVRQGGSWISESTDFDLGMPLALPVSRLTTKNRA